MAAIAPHARALRPRPWSGKPEGLTTLWRHAPAGYGAPPESLGAARRAARRLLAILAVGLLALTCGFAIAAGGWNGLYLAVSVVGCAFILLEFRVGVVLLILLLPISGSAIFPHAMFGVTGLNPYNLLLVGTLGSYLLQGLFDGSIRRFLPAPLMFLYVIPILVAGFVGMRHVGEIAPHYRALDLIEFDTAFGYIRDVVVKPLTMVLFALLVGAAAARSQRPGKFLVPALISMWVMGLMVVIYVELSGVPLEELARSDSRSFLSALGMHANQLGRLYAVAFALLLFAWAEVKEPGVRLVLAASMVLVGAAIMFTFSRSAFFGVGVIFLLFLLWRRNLRALVFFAIVGVAGLFLLPEAVYERLGSGFGSGLNAVSAGRIDSIWLPILPEAIQAPFFGHGLSGVLWSNIMRELGNVYMIGATHLHSAYLETFYNMGIVGLALLGVFWYRIWKGLRRLGRDPDLAPALRGFYMGAAAGLTMFLISGVTDSSLTPHAEQSFLWLAIGMMYGERARRQAP